jgi:hypothetical protein
MATKFYGVGGDNSTGDGTLGNPFLDYDVAVTNTSAGDSLSLAKVR